METQPSDGKENASEQCSQASSVTMPASIPSNSGGGGMVSGMHHYEMYNPQFYYNPYGMYNGGSAYNPYQFNMYGQYAHYGPPMPHIPPQGSLPPPPPPPLPQPGSDTADSKPVAPDEKMTGAVLSNVDRSKVKDMSCKTEAMRSGQQRPGSSFPFSVSTGSAYSSDVFYSRFSAPQGYTSFEGASVQPAIGPKTPTSEGMSSKVKDEKEIYSPFAPTGFDESPMPAGKFKRFGKQAPDVGAIRFNLPKRNNMIHPQGKPALGMPEPRNRFDPAEQGRTRQQSPRAFMQQWKSVKYQGEEEPRAEDLAEQWPDAGTRERGQRGFYGMEEKPQMNGGAVTPKWQADRQGEVTRASRWDDPVPGDAKSGTPVKIKAEVSTEAPVPTGGDWPPALKLYVQRCFASVSDEQKDEMEQVLKDKLTVRFKSGSAMSHNWDVEPIPRLPSSSSLSGILPSPRRWETQPDTQALQQTPQSDRSVAVAPLYNNKFSGMSLGVRGGRRAKNDRKTWSPPGFRRKSRSRSHSSSRSKCSRRRSKSRSSGSRSTPESMVVRKRRHSTRYLGISSMLGFCA